MPTVINTNAPVNLNQYAGTDELGAKTAIVAENMETACRVYADENGKDPVIMQTTLKNIKTVLPVTYTSFETTVFDAGGQDAAALAGCTATPERYTLPAGDKQVFTATEATGWTFQKWTIAGQDVPAPEGTKKVALLEIPKAPDIVKIQAVFTAAVGP